MDISILKALGIVDCAVLLRENKSQFRLLDGAQAWLIKLLPTAQKEKTILIEDASLFLSDFLLDAEEFWNENHEGQVKSGIWTEQYGDEVIYLEAFAAVHEEDSYLIIKNAEQIYHERKQTLQIARELAISNDEVIERHDYLSERLRAILLDNAQSESRLPLHEAIRYANIGVIITDEKLFVQEVNPAAFDIFDLAQSKDQDSIFNIVVDLIERQYPEKSIFSSNKHWTGEVYWHTPPIASRWLKLNINPVLGDTGQVKFWIVSFNDQTRIKHLLQTNEELALHDPLTGLPNRQYFWQTLQSCTTNQEPFYLLSVDIVNFKNTNELHGYLEGDNLLKQVAIRLRNELNEGDFITRMGADEFMVIRKRNDSLLSTQNTSFEEDTYALAKRLNEQCNLSFTTSKSTYSELAIKIGVTEYPKDASNAEELLVAADLALSFAKANQADVNNPIQFYSNDIKKAANRRHLLEKALRLAIDRNELELYLQPIYEIKTDKIIKAEALLRWNFNDEIIMPDEFIPIAESSELINIIGRWVICRACEIVKQLQSINVEIPISINFSPKQIHDTGLIGFIGANIEMMNVDTRLLELEVTEGVLINNYGKVSAFLHDLKRKGLSISVDDFGTGYCSLAYLKHLPIDTLKIDRSFIKDVTDIDNENDKAIVNAIISLAENLNLGIVAEGIETDAQQDFLLTHKCNFGQGYLLSRPLPVNEFERLLSTKKH
jgi:diguanylate cyclase (GGDEF)-like protein